MATNDTQSDAASSSDDDGPPSSIEYPSDVDEQEIKLDLADRVSESDAVSGIETFSIDEQDDGSQVATVTWESTADVPASAANADGGTDTTDPDLPSEVDASVGDADPETADTDQTAATAAGSDVDDRDNPDNEASATATDDTAESDDPATEQDDADDSDGAIDASDVPDDDDDTVKTESTSAGESTDTEPSSDADGTEADTDEVETDAEGTDTGDVESNGEPSRPSTFEAAIVVGEFRTALAPVDALVDECRFHLAPDGLTIRAVDAANVAMAELQLSSEAFDAYQADTGTIGIDLDRFLDAVTMGDTDDIVHLTLNPETGKLEIAIDNLEVTMALIDPQTIRAEPDIPDLNLPAHITCRTDDLDRIVTATDMVADHLRLIVDPDADLFVAEARGDTDSVRVERDADDLEAFTPGDGDSLFSLDYLSDIVGAIPSDTDISADLGDAFPLKLTYTLADGHGDVECMLAPRIENE